jgi:hypothetical protein
MREISYWESIGANANEMVLVPRTGNLSFPDCDTSDVCGTSVPLYKQEVTRQHRATITVLWKYLDGRQRREINPHALNGGDGQNWSFYPAFASRAVSGEPTSELRNCSENVRPPRCSTVCVEGICSPPSRELPSERRRVTERAR